MEKEKDLSIREAISINRDFYQALQSDVLKIVSCEKEKMYRKSNTNSYGKRKGFIHSGSDFD